MDPGLIQYPDHAVEKGVPRGSPKFFPIPTIASAQITCRAHPVLSYIPQHKHNLIILYQEKTSQLNTCLKADVIICQSEQVDEDLSQLILALPYRARISVHSQHDTSKIDLTLSLNKRYHSFIHRPLICLLLASL